MSFLQPLLLFGLPLIGLPILIHLINRQRHRTIHWGAMMFLLDAQRLQKGMATLRYWLIMAMRMLAMAGLIFAVSRPQTSGWLGSAVGSQADTTLILLDRSPSMEQQDARTGESKREIAINKLQTFFSADGASGGRAGQTIFIENTRCQAESIDVGQMMALPEATATDAPADIPRMLEEAYRYLVANEVGKADVWIASDLRRNDWQPDDGRWKGLARDFAMREGVRFHLLTYSQPSEDNLSVTVRNVRKRSTGDAQELVMDVIVRRVDGQAAPQTPRLRFVIDGATSVLDIEIAKEEFVLQGHVIPLDAATTSGWGRVELPGDDNRSDNVFYFTFAEEPVRRITVVSDDAESARPLVVASRAPYEPGLQYEVTELRSDQVAEIDWSHMSLLIWQAPLPNELVARQLQAFLNLGMPVLFLPPNVSLGGASEVGTNEFLGVRWTSWQSAQDRPVGVNNWRDDSDLLAKTLSATSLPVGKLQLFRWCQLEGPGVTLARLESGSPLLLRADGNVPAYFLATLPRDDCSTLARDGVLLYVTLQRAIALGANLQGDARQVDTGTAQTQSAPTWQLVSELPEQAVSAARPFFAAAYRDGDRAVAVNRSEREDDVSLTSSDELESMFAGLDYHQIQDETGNTSPLASEIWRAFLALMAVALMAEAALCLG